MPDYSPYLKEVALENLGVKGRGPATATWAWAFIPYALADNLRDYRTDTTTRDLAIRTWVPKRNAFVPFLADMVWPKSEKLSCGKLLAFSISFVNLIEIEEVEVEA
jgi:hypothetical protein